MLVHYYAVHGCEFLSHEGKPVIIAPPGTAEEPLREQGFQRDNNGKWYKFLNEKEYHDVMIGFPDNDVTFTDENYPPQYTPCPEDNSEPENPSIPMILNVVSLMLIIGAIALPANFEGGLWNGGLWLAGFVLIIILRIRYPGNPFGKAFLIIYSVILVIISIIMFWAFSVLGGLFFNFLTCNWNAC